MEKKEDKNNLIDSIGDSIHLKNRKKQKIFMDETRNSVNSAISNLQKMKAKLMLKRKMKM